MAELSSTQRKALREMETASTNAKIDEIRWDTDFRGPKFISGTLSAPSADDPETIARRFLARTADLVVLPPGVEERLDVVDVTADAQGFRHVTFQQLLAGVPVFEGSIQVHIDPQGQVVGFKANRAMQVDVSTTPTVTAVRALELAHDALAEASSERVPPQQDLLWFRDDAGRPYLTWHVRLFSDQDLATYHYFIDAHTGRLLYKYNDLRHVMARETYTADNQESLPGRLIIREGENGHTDGVAWEAHANAAAVYAYYLERFGRDSYDNQGASLRATVHFSQSYNNAFWSPALRQMVYGDGDGVQFSPLTGALDVVAHELTHAVTASTARFVYADEAGALDESFADFFGVMISNDDPVTDWNMGEHVYTPGRPGDALRDVSDPPRSNQPDHADAQRRLPAGELPECNPRSPAYNDNAFVHTNNGIPNKAGFLMVAGGTHRGVVVQGLGKQAAEQIMYLALTVYMQSATPSRWTFRQARLATLDACRQLFPNDAQKLAAVMNAWAAVGVGEPAQPVVSDSALRVEVAPRLDIPDATPAGVTSVLTVPGSGSVSSLKVSVDIAHSYIGDLRIVLTAPNGTAVTLHDRQGASTHDLVRSFDMNDTPSLAALLGSPAQGDWRLVVSDLARVDVGQLRRWGVDVGVGEPAPVARGAIDPALAIPDNDPAGVSSAIDIAQTGTVRAIKLSVDITHTFVGDLRVELVAPSQQRVVVRDRAGDSADNLIATFDSASTAALGPLLGLDAQGTWTLCVADLGGQDVGKLNRWSLELTL